MNKLINKILKEATKNDDPFFKPKNVSKRKEELERQKEKFLSKIEYRIRFKKHKNGL